MGQFTNFFENLFGVVEFTPRWYCNSTTALHGCLFIIGNLLITFSCFVIPVIIIRYIIARWDKTFFKPVYLLFAIFFLACGATFLLDIIVFWIPLYRFNALFHFFTAIISLFTVFYLFRILPAAKYKKSPKELEKEIRHLKNETEEELRHKNVLLQLQNEKLSSIAWMASHQLRGPVASIMGLSKLFNHDDLTDPDNAKIIEGIHATTKELDVVVRELVAKASTRNTE